MNFKTFFFLIVLLISLGAIVSSKELIFSNQNDIHISIDLINGTGLWNESGTEILPYESTLNLQIPSLTNCDTIDTNANGIFSCGTDATGSGESSSAYWNQLNNGTNRTIDPTALHNGTPANFSGEVNVKGKLNATELNGTLSCSMINDGSDGDYCVDATGSGESSSAYWNQLNNGTNKTDWANVLDAPAIPVIDKGNISNDTLGRGTLTDTKICIYDLANNEVDCTYTDLTSTLDTDTLALVNTSMLDNRTVIRLGNTTWVDTIVRAMAFFNSFWNKGNATEYYDSRTDRFGILNGTNLPFSNMNKENVTNASLLTTSSFFNSFWDKENSTKNVCGMNSTNITCVNGKLVINASFGGITSETDPIASAFKINRTLDEIGDEANRSLIPYIKDTNTSAKIYTDAQDNLQDECSEITNCVSNADPSETDDFNKATNASGWDMNTLDDLSLSNFTNSSTINISICDGKFCFELNISQAVCIAFTGSIALCDADDATGGSPDLSASWNDANNDSNKTPWANVLDAPAIPVITSGNWSNASLLSTSPFFNSFWNQLNNGTNKTDWVNILNPPAIPVITMDNISNKTFGDEEGGWVNSSQHANTSLNVNMKGNVTAGNWSFYSFSEFLGYIIHRNTAPRVWEIPDISGILMINTTSLFQKITNATWADTASKANDLICTNCITGTEIAELADADISDTLTASDLVAISSVVSDAEVDDTITAINYIRSSDFGIGVNITNKTFPPNELNQTITKLFGNVSSNQLNNSDRKLRNLNITENMTISSQTAIWVNYIDETGALITIRK